MIIVLTKNLLLGKNSWKNLLYSQNHQTNYKNLKITFLLQQLILNILKVDVHNKLNEPEINQVSHFKKVKSNFSVKIRFLTWVLIY